MKGDRFMKIRFFPGCLLMSAEGEGGGEPGGGPSAGQIATLEARLAAAQGSASVVAQQLYNELFSLRGDMRKKEEANAALTAEVADLKKKIPAEDARILTQEEAVAYEALGALGKPEEIKKKLDALPALEQRIADSERATLVSKVAELAGFNAKVFAPLAKDLQFEIKAEAGKEVAYVKTSAEGKETL